MMMFQVWSFRYAPRDQLVAPEQWRPAWANGPQPSTRKPFREELTRWQHPSKPKQPRLTVSCSSLHFKGNKYKRSCMNMVCTICSGTYTAQWFCLGFNLNTSAHIIIKSLVKQFPPKNVWQQQKRKQELDTPFHLTSTLSKAASLLAQTFIKTTRLLLPEINRKTFQDKKKNVHVNWIAKSTVFVCITSLNVCAQNQSSNSTYTANA